MTKWKTVYFPVQVTSIIWKIKMPTQPPILKKLSKKLHHINPLGRSQMIVNMSESSAVWPRVRQK